MNFNPHKKPTDLALRCIVLLSVLKSRRGSLWRAFFVCCLVFGISSGVASGQGLIWKLPASGQWVKFSGEFTQTMGEGQHETLTFVKHVTLKSLSTERAIYKNSTVNAQWVEIKVETGHLRRQIFERGPGGLQQYKLLVPVDEISRDFSSLKADGFGDLKASLPVIRGYRQTDQQPIVDIESGLFQVYPVVALLEGFREFKPTRESNVSRQVRAGSLIGSEVTAASVTETFQNRSTCKATIFLSEEVPFGVASWSSSVTLELKASTDSRDTYSQISRLAETMEAIEFGTGAISEVDGQ